jgi:hypothetical protein
MQCCKLSIGMAPLRVLLSLNKEGRGGARALCMSLYYSATNRNSKWNWNRQSTAPPVIIREPP